MHLESLTGGGRLRSCSMANWNSEINMSRQAEMSLCQRMDSLEHSTSHRVLFILMHGF